MCEFLNKAIAAYSKHATCMVEKLPQSSDFLKTVTETLNDLLSFTDLKDYEKYCRKTMTDPTLPLALVEKKFVRADIWWFKLKDKYPLLSKMSLALITIFHISQSGE